MKESESIQINTSTRLSEFPQECFAVLLKYLNLGDIMLKVMSLSKGVRNSVITENYLIFKHFIRYFNLSQRLKRADIPAKINIMQLIHENVMVSKTQKPENLMPFCFFTDGGCYNDDYYYFLHNIFSKTGVCYSTRTPKDANIMAYLGRRIAIDPN